MSAAVFIYIAVFLASIIPIYLTMRAESGFGKYSKRTTAFLLVWIIFTYFIGESGFLQDFTTVPPRFFLLLPIILVGLFFLVKTEHSKLIMNNTSIYALIGMQSFRFLPELFLDLAYQQGLAPRQMTYHGQNPEVLVAILATIILILGKRIPISPSKLGVIFSVVGLGFLSNIIAIAILSTPTPIRVFMNEPANTFITQAPYIWLPTVLVSIAFWGHFLLIGKLLKERSK